VVGEPEIVTVEEGDQGSPRLGDADVVRTCLLTEVVREVDKADAGIIEAGDERGGVVRAGIAHDNHFPMAEGLATNTFDRTCENAAPVVRRRDNRDGRPIRLQCHGSEPIRDQRGVEGMTG
jgi:hypothetical protein